LIAIDQGADDRGSRLVGNAPDLLYEILKGAWYGWPDFIGGEPITDPKYLLKRGPAPTFILANHDELRVPETPLLRFSLNTVTAKFDAAYSSNVIGGYSSYNSCGDDAGARQQILLFVALFRDERPTTAPIGGLRVGRAVVCVDANNWTMHTLIDNDNDNRMSRPIDVHLILPMGHCIFLILENLRSVTITASRQKQKVASSGGLCPPVVYELFQEYYNI
jgi:hypothetical protein